MKVSRYNKFFDSEEGIKLAYNCLTDSLATLTNQKFHQVKEILASPNTYRFDTKAKEELRDSLFKGGFLLDDEIDELGFLKVRNRIARFDPSHLRLTIIPTLRCNFRCTYCYEGSKTDTMSKEMIKGLVDFVKQKTKNVKSMTVNWYGGEPLLALDAIIYLRDEFEKVCKINGCSYNNASAIITNGYLLTKERAQRLRDLGIDAVQVTLDGPKGVHDQRRSLTNGKGTFDQIIDNLCQTVGILKFITIRVNTDKTNEDTVLGLLEVLEERGLKDKVNIYFAKVMAHTEACANITGSCLMDQEYSELEVKLTKKGIERGFNLKKYPRVKFSYCDADMVSSFVVGPDGFLYKCWSDPGNATEAVGHISDPMLYAMKKKNVWKWLAWDVFEREKCRKCDVLPICMGGCPYVGLRMESQTEGACDTWRHNLLDMLKLYYTNYCHTAQKRV